MAFGYPIAPLVAMVGCYLIIYLDYKIIIRLYKAIRAHRDARGDDRCWLDDDALYRHLPEGFTPPNRDTSVELGNCLRYIESRHDPRVTYISPQREIENQQKRIASLQKYWDIHKQILASRGEKLPVSLQVVDRLIVNGIKTKEPEDVK